MIECDSQAERAHLLLVVIQNDKVPIDAIILCDQMQQRHPNIAKSDKVLPFHLILQIVDANSIVESGLGLIYIVPNLEDSSLVLQIVENLCVHLH